MGFVKHILYTGENEKSMSAAGFFDEIQTCKNSSSPKKYSSVNLLFLTGLADALLWHDNHKQSIMDTQKGNQKTTVMGKLTSLLVFLTIFTTSAQDRYTQGMEKAFQLWESGQTGEASNLFERIATAEPDNWLPYYYASQINTVISFGEKDEKKLTVQLEKAKEFLDVAKAISQDNPEILIQEALINTAWIVFDGATYGMTLSQKNAQLYQRALELAPDNPRVVFSKAEWDMGAARYFGKDTAPYCKDVEKALELFATFKSETPFYPSWGKERAEEVLASCK